MLYRECLSAHHAQNSLLITHRTQYSPRLYNTKFDFRLFEVVNSALPSLHHPREADPLHKKTVGKVVVRKVGSGLRHIGKQMVLKPSVVTGGEDDHSLYDIDEADDISLLMVSGDSPTLLLPQPGGVCLGSVFAS